MNVGTITAKNPYGENTEVGHIGSSDGRILFLEDVLLEAKKYTLSMWVKASANSTIMIDRTVMEVTTSWQKKELTFTHNEEDTYLTFGPGEFWIYEAKLEEGTFATAFTIDPEDTDAIIAEITKNVTSQGTALNVIQGQISTKIWMTDIDIATNEINSKYSEVAQTLNGLSVNVGAILNDYATYTEYQQLADKFSWIVASGDSASSMTLTDKTYSLISDNITLTGNHIQLDGNTTVGDGFVLSADHINATSLEAIVAKIGGFDISATSIYNGTDSILSTKAGVYLGVDGIRQYRDANNFVNIQNGVLTAKNVDLSGTITATSGKIANYTISGGYIYNGIGIGTAGSCGISCGTNLGGSNDWVFWANNGAFRVDYDGYMVANNASIVGDVTANTLKAKNNIYVQCNAMDKCIAQADPNNWNTSFESINIGAIDVGIYAHFQYDEYNRYLDLVSPTVTVSGKLLIYGGNPDVPSGGLSCGNANVNGTLSVNKISKPYSGQLVISSPSNTSAGDVVCKGAKYGMSVNSGGVNSWDYINATWAPMQASAFNVKSSRKAKHDIRSLTQEEANKILNVETVSFKYNDTNLFAYGVIAEDVYDIIPEVTTLSPEDNTPYMVDYSKFIPFLIKMTQIHENNISKISEDYEQKYIDLLFKYNELQARVTQLESEKAVA